jgi:uncharacterized membrane protein
MAETPYQRDMRRMAESMETQARIAKREEDRRLRQQELEILGDVYVWWHKRRTRKAAAAQQHATTGAAGPQPTAAQQPTADYSAQPSPEPSPRQTPPADDTLPPVAPSYAAQPAVPDTRAWTTLGIAGFALAIIALWLPIMGMNTAVSIGAGILGYLGVQETRNGALRGRGWSIAAIVLAGFGLLAQAIHFLAVLTDLIIRFLPGH